MKELTFNTPDVNGYVPDFSLLGRCFKHTGNGKFYRPTGFVWLGETDEWGFKHVRVDPCPIEFCRPISHLTGNRSNGEKRYVEVDLREA